MVAKTHEQAKTSRSERPRRRHLDDGSFVRLPPVNINSSREYTGRQLYGITQLVYRFASQLVEIYVNVNVRPLTRFKRPPPHTVMVDHHFCPVQRSLHSREFWFPQLPKGSVVYLCCSHSAKSRLCMQITSLANQHQACNYWKYCSVLRFGAFSEGNVENYWSVTRCQLNSPVPCSWGQQSLPRGYVGTIT